MTFKVRASWYNYLTPPNKDLLPSTTTARSKMSDAPPKTDSWADEVASPTTEAIVDPLAKTQLDGATEFQGGSGIQDSQYEVEVKLSDMQTDTTSPLYSVSSFEELGLYV